MEEALRWAVEPVVIAGRPTHYALLTQSQDPGGLTAAAELRELDDQSERPPVPEAMWLAALDAAADDEALSTLGWSAMRADERAVARRAFAPLAHAGQAEAMGLFGILTTDPEDPDTAERWFERAAETRDVFAMLNYGTHLRPSDPAAARYWLLQAAEAGNAEAMIRLGQLLEDEDLPKRSAGSSGPPPPATTAR